jgi:hypothetical protein
MATDPNPDSALVLRGLLELAQFGRLPESTDGELRELLDRLDPPEEEHVPEDPTQLPDVSELKQVWRDHLVDVGVSEEWTDAKGRTKNDLVQAARAIADGRAEASSFGETETEPDADEDDPNI